MSNKILVQTQNFFVDTSKPEIGECRNATFVLPQGLMDCDESQEMRLTLNAFSMRNNWHRINQNNQVYFIVGKSNATPPVFTSTRVQLGDGNYELFSASDVLGTPPTRVNQSLGNNIQFGIERALQRTHGAHSDNFSTHVIYDNVSGKYAIAINTSSAPTGTYAGGLKLVCFTIQQGTPIPNDNLAYAILNTPHHLGFVSPDPGQTKPTEWYTYGHATAQNSAPLPLANNQWQVLVFNGPPTAGTAPVFSGGVTPEYGDFITWTGVIYKNKVTFHAEIVSYSVVQPKVSGSNGPRGLITCVGTTDQIENANISFIRDGGDQFILVDGTTNHQVEFVTSSPGAGNYPADANPEFTNGVIDGQQINFPNDPGYSLTPANYIDSTYGLTGVISDSGPTKFVMQRPYDIDFVTSGYADMDLFHTIPTTEVVAVGLKYNKIEINTSYDPLAAVGMKVTSSDTGLPSGTTVSAVTDGGTSVDVTFSQASTFHEQTLTVPTGTYTAGDIVDQGAGASQGTVKTTVTGTTIDVTVTVGTFAAGVADIGSQPNVTVSAVAPVTRQFEYTFTTTLTATGQKSNSIWLSTALPTAEKEQIIDNQITWAGKPANSPHVVVNGTHDYGSDTPPKTRIEIQEGDTEEIPIDSSILFRPTNSGDNPTVFTDAFQSTFEVLGGCYEDRGTIPGADASAQFDNLRSMMQVTTIGDVHTCEAFYPATLQSEENVYLRTDIGSTAFQSAGFDTGVQRNVASSQILAKIPLNNPTFAAVNEWYIEKATIGADPQPAHSAVERVYMYERPFEVIYFTDNGNNEYSVMLSSKKTSHIRLFVTDKFGRLIPSVSQQQIDCGGLSFTASLRIDIFETPTLPQE